MRDPRHSVPAVGAALLLTFFVGRALVAGLTVPQCDRDCPDVDALAAYKSPEAPHVLDRSGRLVTHLPGIVRVWVPLQEMPELLKEGLVAVEDARFYQHNGVDPRGVVRAAWANIQAGSVRQGASTITMQLARTLWSSALEGTNKWQRKAAEVRLARRMEAQLSKSEILELYLNEIYLGQGVYGVGAAALHYFGISPAELSVDQIATIVAMVKTPERYNPRTRPSLAADRRNVVLEVFGSSGLLATDSVAHYQNVETPVIWEQPARQGRSYAAAAVWNELRSRVPDPAERNGAVIHTTLDWELQARAEEIVSRYVAELESRRDYPHEVPGDELATVSGESPFLQASGIVVDAHSGAILATVGGRDFNHSEFDRAMQARRQPGSAFKPIVYAAALGSGKLTLADAIELAPLEWIDDQGEVWSPRDPLAGEHEVVSVRQALALSSNLAAVHVGLAAGPRNVVRYARDLGIAGPLPPYPSTFLGAAEVTPLEMATAFGVIANGGHSITPHLITRIEDREGRVLYDAASRQGDDDKVGIDPRAAFLTREALAGVVDGGTGWRVRREGVDGPVIGKTGTSNGSRDLWFVGATPRHALAVWVGFDTPTPVLGGRATASREAAPLWGRLAKAVTEADGAGGRWPKAPLGLTRWSVRPPLALAAGAACAEAPPREVWFIAGTERQVECDARSGAPAVIGSLAPTGDDAVVRNTRTDVTARTVDSRRSGG